MSDYIFRGVTQSNHKPSVAAYFEPRYNINKDLQLYVGVSAESISFPNRAAAEVDIYGGIRPTFGAFAFDIGVWGYLYPGGQCFNGAAFPGSGIPGSETQCILNGNLPNAFLTTGVPGNVAKRSASFFEVYGKGTYTINDNWAIGLNEYYSPNFLNLGAWGNYSSGTVKWTAPQHLLRHFRRRHVRLGRVRPPVARHLRLVLRRDPVRSVPELHGRHPRAEL